MLQISVSADVARIRRQLDDVARRQLPFAAARALTAAARRGAEAERQAMRTKLDRPSPFTLRGVAVQPARKEDLKATVLILPEQARYLAPSIVGGPQILGRSRGILRPKNIRLDRYGNIPPGLLAALKGRPDIFIGTVDFRDGQKISGVWQMPPAAAAAKSARLSHKGLTGGRHRKGWKLLIRFSDPVDIAARYPFGAAIANVKAHFPADLDAALARAVATAR